MSEIPSVKVLQAINPANSGTGEEELIYHGLAIAVDRYAPTNAQRSTAVWVTEAGSLEELSKAKQLASEYLLRTSRRVVEAHSGNRDLWADRFTQAAIELYGEPDQAEARRLLTNEYNFLTQLRCNQAVSQRHVEFLLHTYKPMSEQLSIPATAVEAAEIGANSEKAAIKQYGEAMRERYRPLFDLVDSAGKDEFTATDLRELFTQALSWLEDNDDPKWAEWEVAETDGTSLSVEGGKRRINIATRRETASLATTRGLIAHELLVHALRAKNGYTTGDRRLATGLAGYLDAEEGLGILAEEAINGELPDKAYDRYVDIALALGTVDGMQRSRQGLFEISYARQLIRPQFKGANEAEVATLAPRVWGHVDRIYRGGKGDSDGARQAIFTKDIAYYVGYKQMAKYITRQLAEGKTAAEVFAYLSQGKFDPTNAKHVERLAKASAQKV